MDKTVIEGTPDRGALPGPSARSESASSRFRRVAARSWREVDRCRREDRFSIATFLLVLSVLSLTIGDGLLTLLLLDDRYEEANPAMRVLLRVGPCAFVLGKYLLTAIGLPILLIYRRRTIFIEGLRVEHVLPAIVSLYVILIVYQLGLLAQV